MLSRFLCPRAYGLYKFTVFRLRVDKSAALLFSDMQTDFNFGCNISESSVK